MSVSGVSTSAARSNALSSANVLGENDFLNLLVAQLKNQDPMNPSDSTAFVAQLAQFSSLQQETNVNTNLQTLQMLDQSINNAQATNYIGKTVKATGDSFDLTAGTPYTANYELADNAGSVAVNIYDSDSNLVKTITTNNVTAGAQTITWDGTETNGNAAPSGTYSFKVSATDKDGNAMSTAAYVQGNIIGSSYHDGKTYLVTDKDNEIPYADIIEADESSASTTPATNSTSNSVTSALQSAASSVSGFFKSIVSGL